MTWLTRLARAVLWGLLIAGLLLGMAWACLHFWIVPRISEFRPALESLARQSLGVPVRIGVLSARSTGWIPSFELREIELLDKQGRPALLLPKVVVAISLRSVLQLRLDQLVLDTPELDVRLNADGRWQVAGLDWPQTPQGDSTAADWLFSQREVVIRGGTLHWHDESNRHFVVPGPGAAAADTALSLRDVDVVMRNSARRHDLRLDATPPPGWGDRFVVMGKFRRSLLSVHAGRWRDWSGQAYALFPHIDMAQLHMRAQPHVPTTLTSGLDLTQGQGALRLWTDVDKGQWRGGVADVALKALHLRLGPQSPAWVLQHLTGRLGVQVRPDGFLVSTRGLAFVTDQGLVWPGGNLALDYTHAQGLRAAKGHLQADQLDLQALRELTLRWPAAQALHPALQTHEVAGRVSSLQMRWQGHGFPPEKYDLQASVQGLNWLPQAPVTTALPPSFSPAMPGVRGADLKVDMNEATGRLTLQMDKGSALWFPGVLSPAEVPVHSVQARLRWERETHAQGTHWRVPQWHLKLANADLQGEWHGQWQALPGGAGPGVLDLQGSITRADVTAAHRYLPLSLPESVRHYVRDALVKGQYSDVKVKVQGNLSKLPFAHPEEGEFRFSGRLKDVSYDMMPASFMSKGAVPWPRLQGLQGQLTFDRLGMKLTDATARTGDASNGFVLSAPMTEIADMAHQPLLQVSAESRASAPQVLNLIRQSPLNAMLSGVLQEAQGTGPLQTRFKLNVPLLTPESTQVQGSVQFNGNDLRITSATPWLEKIQGTLQFHEGGFGVNKLQAQMLGGPVQIEGGLRATGSHAGAAAASGTVAASGAEPAVLFHAQGRVSATALRAAREFFPIDGLAQHAGGSTAYSARLGWQQGQPDLSLQSTLEGLSLQLPAPLGKTTNSAMPLSIRIQPQGDPPGLQDQIQVTLGDVARVHYVRDVSGATPRVLRGSLSLGVAGEKLPTLSETGVTANVVMDRLSLDEWRDLVPALASSTSPGHPAAAWSAYLPTRIGLKANTLTAEDRTLHQVVAGGTRDGSQWQANIDAQELSGYFTFRPSLNNPPGQLFARLSRLNLPPSSAAEVETLLETPSAKLPALDIVVDELELRGKKLGRIEIEAINTDTPAPYSPNTAEWQLKKFNIQLPEGSLRSTGRWLAAREGSPLRKTEMNFVLDVNDAGALLTRLGTPDALRNGTGKLEGTVSWQGSPLSLHYPSMNGHFEVNMGKGQFLKADAGAAKLLGVLSLQALPRRLLLDFRDVFSDGFAFDSVHGDVTIVHGMASTRNLQIKGVNAVVQLDGSANLAQETQRLRAVILPVVDAGTASLLAGLALNPMVGLTTFLAQWLLQNPLSQASTQEFMIDGSWTDPRVTRIDKRATPGPSSGPASSP
ncbi:YhdP family protein [Limnohabitans sp. 2KL-1]|uniref:YhdP family protein n=1 Tax=Limnohabitans sp. 2KL-1 TaxID=1100699 RepID=UPI000D36B910|nr:YhdP family protein [Limnohabitans sp. 2KL-1]